jgi:hypothetical protein
MDFANRGNRPSQAPQNQAGPSDDQPSQTFKPAGNSSRSGMNINKLTSLAMIFASTLLVLVLVLGLIFVNPSNGRSEEDLIATDKYQAVFLDSQDGQVYFGKLAVYNKDLYMLTDIYYVRVENPIQPQGTEAQQPNISLAKLGNELHGPQDYMFVARDKVLYWENLKNDGQVVTAITNFKANGETTPTTNDGAAGGTQPAGTSQQNDTPAETPDTTTP